MHLIKNTLLLALSLLSVSVIAQSNLVPNGGFEDWGGTPSAPNHWSIISISLPLIGDFTSASQTTDAHSGSSAILLQTTAVPIPLIPLTIPGAASNGTIGLTNLAGSGGSALSYRPTALKGFYKYYPSGADTATVRVLLTHFNFDTNSIDTLGGGEKQFSFAVNDYMPFYVPIDLWNSGLPDTALISLACGSLTSPVAGSQLYIDDLDFVLAFNGTEELNDRTAEIHAYPIPATNEIKFSGATDLKKGRIEILSVTGVKVETTEVNQLPFTLKTSAFSNGIFFYRIFDDGNKSISNGKFIIQR